MEYRNTIRDLMGIDFNTEVEFPPDDTGHGFDNLGEVLTISPLLLEKYLQAAEEVVDAGGRAVIPGFVDSHSHLVFGGDRAAE